MSGFTDTAPELETYWRSIILFGRNVASHKFALAKSMIELGGREQELIRLEELGEPFARHACEHLIVPIFASVCTPQKRSLMLKAADRLR